VGQSTPYLQGVSGMVSRHLNLVISFILLFSSLFLVHAASAQGIKSSQVLQDSIPPALMPWVPWVMNDNESYRCPFINRSNFADKQNHICAWPSPLTLTVKNTSATFTQSWQILSNSIIPLPGSSEHWPLSVKVNQKLVPVVLHQGKPSLELSQGTYLITGQFSWPEIPESIAIPSEFSFVNMTINNQVIAFPKIERNDLWLQDLQPNKAEHDAIDLSVARRVTDSSYIKLDTYIDLNISGKMREVILGKVLPQGIELIGIESELPSFLDAQGLLHVKVKPGHWQMLVRGYAKPTLLSWQRPAQSHYWPKDEIWVFKGDENLRLGKLTGATMIDNNQAKMPEDWYQLPSYLLRDTDVLNYDIQHRGKPLHIDNQLRLNRTLWLAFDNETYTFSDHITGLMINDWRLSMQAPYILESAEDQDGSVLITSEFTDERGIENRYPGVNIKARGTFNEKSNMSVSGWQSNFERVSLTLNLPPGNKLFAVFGADSVSDSWWSNWSIWASFIVLLAAFTVSRLISIGVGVLTALMLILTYQEAGVPILAMGNFILAIAIKKHQPFTSLKAFVNAYWAMSVAVVVGAVLFFSAMQLRTVIHPQLESQLSAVEHYNDRSAMDMNIVTEQLQSKRGRQSLQSMQEPSVERMEVTGSRIKKSTELMERYQADALIQTGAGIPDWQWQPYMINWHSPVSENQLFDVVVLSKNTYRAIKLLGIVLSLLWLVLMLKDLISVNVKGFRAQALTGLLVLGLCSSGYPVTAEAADFPDQQLLEQLKQRVLAAPDCAPFCAVINKLTLDSNETMLNITLTVHANTDTAIALPRAEFWRPEKILLNGSPIQSLLQHKGWLYIPVLKGISTFSLSGQIAPVDTFELEFKDMPQHVEVNNSQAWQVLGSQGHRLTGNSLSFIAIINETTAAESSLSDGDNASSTRYSYQPFVRVIRELFIDQIWTLKTTVERIAPSTGAINITVPTLTGEHIMSAEIQVNNAEVAVAIPVGQKQFTWRSTIDRQALLSLHAHAALPLIEQWQLIVSPSWHAKISGLPMILGPQDNDDYFSYLFYPYPGETLTVATSRPSAVKGDVIAIDRVNYEIEQGTRTSTVNLLFDYRSTRGGEHIINLPENYQLQKIEIDNKVINLQTEKGALALPILSGKHSVNVLMRANISDELLLASPEVNLNAPVSNITSVINLTQQRWVLWTNGPVIGPAVLYWGELLAFIIFAILVAKVPFSPLSTLSWIALGFGLSLNNWSILMLVALWFASLTASTYRPKTLSHSAFNFSQLILYGLSVLTLLSLLAVIPASLLSTPDMGITGNYSYGNHLQWFSDKSDGLLPIISVLSIPILFYKGLMLAWVIWLSFSSLQWIKWAWGKLGHQGYWRANSEKVVPKQVPDKASEKAPEQTQQ